jgi:D-lactate dehydrogenase
VTRVVSGPADTSPLDETIVRVAARAGLHLWVPPGVEDTCCGMAFSSKGFDDAYALAVHRLVGRLHEWTAGGRLPVVMDTSPCAWSLATSAGPLTILDSVAFAHDVVLPRLAIEKRARRVAVHPACSVVKLGLVEKLTAVVRACADECFVPPSAGCCGFAGDRGITHPELTAAATAREAAEIEDAGAFDAYVSTSRTCEIGMTRATGRPFVSLWHLLDAMS